jgi:long-chain acyl-CoA synthetase
MLADPITEAFDSIVRRDPLAPLVATPARRATRGEVDSWARAAAAKLIAAGAVRGERALVFAANGAGFLAALLACRRSGLVAVLADCTSPPAERERVAAALGVTLSIACDAAFPTRDNDFAVARRGADEGTPGSLGDAGYVKLTSGSSGESAGIALTADALVADDEQLVSTMGLKADDRLVAAIPWSHSYGLSSLVLPALRRGSLLVLPEDGGPWSPLLAARALRATVFPTVPVYVTALATLAEPAAWPASIRTVISAGAPLQPESAARFRETFGRNVHVFYGASECGGIAYDRSGAAALAGTVGTPVDGVDVELAGDGLAGEGVVTVRSAAVALSYLPSPGDRLSRGVFRSSDLASWTAEGALRLLGRADAVINVGGKKVHPREVETVLRGLPGIDDTVVLGLPASSGDREIVRAVVACAPGRLTYAAIADWCRGHLAAHKVPRSIVIVEAIPRNARGKPDRAALLALDASPSSATR